jgi:Tfp pilus assembly ATPase PilU
VNLLQLLKALAENKAEGLVVTTGSPPWLKVNGEWVPLKTDALDPVTSKTLVYAVLGEPQKDEFERQGALTFSFGVKDFGRFICDASMQRGAVMGTFRMVPMTPPTPPAWVAQTLSWLAQGPGVVIAAAPVMQPERFVLDWWVEHLNRTEHRAIVTVSKPIGLIHPHKNSVVNQVEVGPDTSLALALEAHRTADVLALHVDDGLTSVNAVAHTGALVLANLTAPTADVARALVQDKLAPAFRSLLRGLVFQEPGGTAAVFDAHGVL